MEEDELEAARVEAAAAAERGESGKPCLFRIVVSVLGKSDAS